MSDLLPAADPEFPDSPSDDLLGGWSLACFLLVIAPFSLCVEGAGVFLTGTLSWAHCGVLVTCLVLLLVGFLFSPFTGGRERNSISPLPFLRGWGGLFDFLRSYLWGFEILVHTCNLRSN